MVLFCGFVILFGVEITANKHQNHPPKTLAEANQVISLLQENLQSQHNQIQTQQEKIQAIEQQYENLQQQLTTLLRNRYGKKSEQLPDGFNQLNLFDEPELSKEELERSTEESIKTESITYTRKKKKRTSKHPR